MPYAILADSGYQVFDRSIWPDVALEVSIHLISSWGEYYYPFSLYFGFRIGDNAKFKCGEGFNFVNFVCPHMFIKKNQKIRKIIQKYLYFVYILVNKPVDCVLESIGLDKNSTSKIFLKKETGKRDKQRKTYMIVFTLLPIPSVTWAYLSLLLYICSFRI